VFTFPEALHLVMNEGFNVAVAINFFNKAWKKHIPTVFAVHLQTQKGP
jgi:hypothetical protein